MILEQAFGKNHPSIALSLHNLAQTYREQGRYVQAESLHQQSLAITKATFGNSHPDTTTMLQSLALLHLAQRRLSAAVPLFERAFAGSEDYLRHQIFAYSEAQLADALAVLHDDEERLYTLARTYPDSPRARQLALSAAILRKGRSVQEIANTSLIIYRNLGEADRQAFERLRALRTQLAASSLAGPGNLSLAAYQQHLKELTSEGDALEADLARRSEPLRRVRELPSPDQLLPRVSAALPKDGVLIEIVAYQDSPLVPPLGSPSSQVSKHLRYLALLLFPHGHTRIVDLGPSEPIEQAASRFQHALARRSTSYLAEAQTLYKLTFRPLMPHLGKARRLFLTPDGQLNLVPFAALHNGRQFLMDIFDITYLSSGKDLLRRSEPPSSSSSMVILADPDFGTASAVSSPGPQGTLELTQRAPPLEDFFSAIRSSGPDIPWAPLPGTRREAEAIHRLFPKAKLLLGTDATKDALLKVSSPGLLHIATHGFFLEDTLSSQESRSVGYSGALAAGPQTYPKDPLLRSGLVLAGAHPQTAAPSSYSPDDSLVTALELAGLNLWGTQLVVLSACDTGRGDVKLGDGVYGLRRAFLVAGTETVVTSLWKVNDDATHQLMERYYRHLLEGQGRTSALHQAMKELRRTRPHPHFWAGFTALGSNAPLQRLTPQSQPAP